MGKTVILSLGGSVIVPEKIDTDFLKGFKKIIVKFVKKGNRFVIYCGGGKLARDYQKALSRIIGADQAAMDWIGISATNLNAFLLRCIFHEYSDGNIIENPNEKLKFDRKIILAAGWKPGWSTDYDAVLLAKNLKIDTIINISNINYVYNKDPKKFMDAVKIKSMFWDEFRKISGKKWKAGLNMPFDPVAAREAQKLGLRVFIIGKNLKNFENLLSTGKFEGTVIH